MSRFLENNLKNSFENFEEILKFKVLKMCIVVASGRSGCYKGNVRDSPPYSGASRVENFQIYLNVQGLILKEVKNYER